MMFKGNVMANVFSFGFENDLIIILQGFMNNHLIKIASFITDFADELAMVSIVGVLYWGLNKKLGKEIVVDLSFINIVAPCIKAIVKRSRPYMVNDKIKILKPAYEGDPYDIKIQSYSFPSLHASNSIAAYFNLFKGYRNPIIKTTAILLIALIGFSRIALGAHYPTDVLAGWLISFVCIAFYHLLKKKIGEKRTFVIMDMIGLLGFFVAKSNDFYTGYGMLLGTTLGILFEEKYVDFKQTDSVSITLIRTVLGGIVFVALSTILKLPFSNEFLESATLLAYVVRTVRYCILLFVLIGVYPLSFKYFKKA